MLILILIYWHYKGQAKNAHEHEYVRPIIEGKGLSGGGGGLREHWHYVMGNCVWRSFVEEDDEAIKVMRPTGGVMEFD